MTYMIEQKISDLEVKHKEKRQRLKLQKPILVTKAVLQISSTVSNHAAEKLHAPWPPMPVFAYRQKFGPHIRPKTIVHCVHVHF